MTKRRRYSIRFLLFGVLVVAIALAVPVTLHNLQAAEQAIVTRAGAKSGLPILLYDERWPKDSSNAHHTFDRHGRAWRSVRTPQYLAFLPSGIQRYCFNRVTSLNLHPEHCNAECISELKDLQSIESVYLIGWKHGHLLQTRLQDRFPGLRVTHDDPTMFQPLGTRRLVTKSGEPSDAPESASRDVSKMEDQPRGPGDR